VKVTGQRRPLPIPRIACKIVPIPIARSDIDKTSAATSGAAPPFSHHRQRESQIRGQNTDVLQGAKPNYSHGQLSGRDLPASKFHPDYSRALANKIASAQDARVIQYLPLGLMAIASKTAPFGDDPLPESPVHAPFGTGCVYAS